MKILKKIINTILLITTLTATQPTLAMDVPNSNDLGMQLIEATKKHDIQQVNDLVTRGANVNAQNHETGYTALTYAASRGCQEIVKKLIDSDADLNQKDKDKDTALMFATRGNYPDIVIMLIKAKADISCKNTGGNTTLHIAAIYECQKIVEMLIDEGAQINIQNLWGHTALIIAATHSNSPICNLLIETNLKRSKEVKERACAFLFCLKHLPCGQPKGQKNTHYSNLKNIFQKTLICSIQEPLINVLTQIHEVRNPKMKQDLLKTYKTTRTVI